jgi:hypothetical protein
LLKCLIAEQRRTNLLLGVIVYFGGGLLAGILLVQLLIRLHGGDSEFQSRHYRMPAPEGQTAI